MNNLENKMENIINNNEFEIIYRFSSLYLQDYNGMQWIQHEENHIPPLLSFRQLQYMKDKGHKPAADLLIEIKNDIENMGGLLELYKSQNTPFIPVISFKENKMPNTRLSINLKRHDKLLIETFQKYNEDDGILIQNLKNNKYTIIINGNNEKIYEPNDLEWFSI